MSYSGFKEDLLDFITSYELNLISDLTKCFIFTSRDIYDLYDGCESTKDASDALNSLWKYDGELARIEVSKIDKALISDRESVPSKGYFYALARYAPTGFEMNEKFKLDEKKEIKPEINVVFTEPEMPKTNKKETEMNNEEKEYAIAVWESQVNHTRAMLFDALKNPCSAFIIIDSFEDVDDCMTELRRLQDEYANRYRMAKKQLGALK